MMAKSLRKAVNENCKDCIYDPMDHGTWRYQVENCTSHSCPLWEVRPKTLPEKRPAKKERPKG